MSAKLEHAQERLRSEQASAKQPRFTPVKDVCSLTCNRSPGALSTSGVAGIPAAGGARCA